MPRVKLGTEQALTWQLAQFLQYHYPNVMYHFDYGSGARLTMGQAIQQKRLNRRAWPDLFIAEPTGGYSGLFLELKKAGTVIVKKDGLLVADVHIREQAKMLRDLQAVGYKAAFAVGFDQAIELVRSYLALDNGSATMAKSDQDTQF